MTRRTSPNRRTARSLLHLSFSIAACVGLVFSGVGVAAAAEEAPEATKERTTHYYLGFFTAGSWVDVTPSGTAVTPGNDTDQSFFWGANLGTEFPIGRWLDLRLELEGTNERKLDFSTPGGTSGYQSEIQAWTFQGNFWIVYPLKKNLPDVPVLNRLSAFGGGGLGLSRNTFDTTNGTATGSDTSVTFAWQGGVGVSFDVARWLVLDVRYQYIDLGSPGVQLSNGDSLEYDLGGNEVVGGLRFVY